MRARDRQATPIDLATTIADPFMFEPSLTTTPNGSFRTDTLPLAPVDSGTTSHLAHCSPRGTPLEPDFARPGSNRSGHLLMVPPTVFRPVRARDRQTAPSALAGPVADPFMSEPSAATRLNHPAPTTVTEGADRIAAGHLGPSRKALSCLPGARRPVGNVAAFTPGPRTREVRRPHTSGSRCKTNHVQITVTT